MALLPSIHNPQYWSDGTAWHSTTSGWYYATRFVPHETVTSRTLGHRYNFNGSAQTVNIGIMADSAGSPSGTFLGYVTNGTWTPGYNWFKGELASDLTLTAGQTYWYVIKYVSGLTSSINYLGWAGVEVASGLAYTTYPATGLDGRMLTQYYDSGAALWFPIDDAFLGTWFFGNIGFPYTETTELKLNKDTHVISQVFEPTVSYRLRGISTIAAKIGSPTGNITYAISQGGAPLSSGTLATAASVGTYTVISTTFSEITLAPNIYVDIDISASGVSSTNYISLFLNDYYFGGAVTRDDIEMYSGPNTGFASINSEVYSNNDLQYGLVYTPIYSETSSASGGGAVTLQVERAVYSETSSASGGGRVSVISIYQALAQKDYEFRVFNSSGTFIGVWQNVSSDDFGYSQSINQNASELTVDIARSPENRVARLDRLLDHTGSAILDTSSDPILVQTETENSVGEGTDVDMNHNVDVYAFYGGYEALMDHNGEVIYDNNADPILVQFGAPNGKRVYSGYIADYELTFGEKTGVKVTIVPHATRMQHYIFKSGTNTTVPYNSVDPVTMARDAMINYNSQGGIISYTASSMPLSGQVSSYDFKLQTTREAIDKTIELLPEGYYHFVDPGENLQYLLQKSATADYTFYYEQHITELKLRRSITQLVNKVYYTGGEVSAGVDLFKYYEDLPSQTANGPGLERLSDSRVTQATSAQALSQSKINDFKNPRYRTSVIITDKVYDIESIKLGKMVGFKNFGSFVDNLVLQIVSLKRAKHSVTLDLDMIVPSDTKRLEELKRNVLSQEVRDIGVAPS